jgi:1,4-dihydroxy-2-naphthoate octaprenyltransferase
LQSRTILQVVILIAVVAALAFVVVRVSTGWADWIVLGVIVLTVLGGARAVFYRRYPTRKRTFIRHSGPGPDQR